MKVVSRFILASLTSIAVIVPAGCERGDEDIPEESKNIQATIEALSVSTKTGLINEDQLTWSLEDKIAKFGLNENVAVYQLVDSYAGKSVGEFKPVGETMADSTAVLALYPYSENLSVLESVDDGYKIVGLSFPQEQIYSAGSFANGSFPMASVLSNDTKDISFKNIGGALRLSLSGDYSVKSITLTGNSGELLSGPAVVNIAADGTLSVNMSSESSSTVTLVCNPAVRLSQDAVTWFYLSLPPTTFEQGFTITIVDDEDNTMTHQSKETTVVSRNSILKFSNVEELPDPSEVAKYVSEYAYNVADYLEDNKMQLQSSNDLNSFVSWMNSQEYVIGVDYDEQNMFAKIRFIDETTFSVRVVYDDSYAGKQNEPMSSTKPQAKSQSENQVTEYDIHSIESETIQDNNKFLYVRGDPYGWLLYDDDVKEIDSPLKVDFVPVDGVNGFEYFEADLSDYGAILITHVHGEPEMGNFAITDKVGNFPDGKINGVIIYVEDDEWCNERVYFVHLKDIYNRISGNHPFVFANYCWSALGKGSVSSGSFAGYSMKTRSLNNSDFAETYFSYLFHGSTHEVAVSETAQHTYDYDSQIVMAEWVGDKNQRYFSISTEELDRTESNIIARAKFNGYKNLKEEVRYKFYYKTGNVDFSPGNDQHVESIDLEEISEDGSVSVDICECFSVGHKYTFKFGFEYNGIIYHGDSKSVDMDLIPETLHASISGSTIRLNGTFKMPVIREFSNYIMGFCYSDVNSTPTVDDSKVVYVNNSNDPIVENAIFYADLEDYSYDTKCHYRFFFKNPHSGEYVYGETKFLNWGENLWVDLGLPSGTLWAAWNIGASRPEEYGGYYGWGDITNYTGNYKYKEDYVHEISGTEYDVATAKWGGGARMPTYSDMRELVYSCTHEIATLNGVKGVYFYGRNGAYIFIPCAGARTYKNEMAGVGELFRYRSSTKSSKTDYMYVHGLIIYENYLEFNYAMNVNRGENVRPVLKK